MKKTIRKRLYYISSPGLFDENPLKDKAEALNMIEAIHCLKTEYSIRSAMVDVEEDMGVFEEVPAAYQYEPLARPDYDGRFEEIAGMDVLRKGHPQEQGDFDESYYQVIVVRVRELNDGVTDRDIRSAFIINFKRRCHCEHDCCGHYFGGVYKTKKLDGGLWLIGLSYSRNF